MGESPRQNLSTRKRGFGFRAKLCDAAGCTKKCLHFLKRAALSRRAG